MEAPEVFSGNSGKLLDSELVENDRKEDMEFMRWVGLVGEVPVEEGWRETGRAPISTKWVDANSGSDDAPDMRCYAAVGSQEALQGGGVGGYESGKIGSGSGRS